MNSLKEIGTLFQDDVILNIERTNYLLILQSKRKKYYEKKIKIICITRTCFWPCCSFLISCQVIANLHDNFGLFGHRTNHTHWLWHPHQTHPFHWSSLEILREKRKRCSNGFQKTYRGTGMMNKYTLLCSLLASANSILLGYGESLSSFLISQYYNFMFSNVCLSYIFKNK